MGDSLEAVTMIAQTNAKPDRFTLASVSVILACTLGNMISSPPVINGTFGSFMVPITADFGWSRTRFTAILTLLSAVSLIAYPVTGRALDKFGPRSTLLAGYIVFPLSLACLSLATSSQLVIYVLYIAAGLSATLTSTVVFAKITGEWFIRYRGMVLGLTTGGGMALGFSVVPVFGQRLIHAYGWRGAFVSIGAAVLVLGWIILGLVARKSPATVNEPRTADAAKAIYGMTPAKARRTSQFWLVLAIAIIGEGCVQAVSVQIFAYAADRNLSTGFAIETLVAGAISNGASQVVIGRALDWTRSPRIAASLVCAPIFGICLIIFSSSKSLWMLGGILDGIGSGTIYGLLPYVLQRYFGLSYFGEIFGLIYGAGMLSMGIFPLLSSAWFDYSGSYFGAFVCVAILWCVTAALLALLPDYNANPAGFVTEYKI